MTTPDRQQMIDYLEGWLKQYANHVPPDNNAFVHGKAILAELKGIEKQVLDAVRHGYELAMMGDRMP